MHTKISMAAILALVLHSILQADSGQGQPPASAPAATAPAPSGPAATTKPSELSLCVAAIGAAPDAVSAAEAYSRGCKIDRSCPALHEAYMRRALQLDDDLPGARSLRRIFNLLHAAMLSNPPRLNNAGRPLQQKLPRNFLT